CHPSPQRPPLDGYDGYSHPPPGHHRHALSRPLHNPDRTPALDPHPTLAHGGAVGRPGAFRDPLRCRYPSMTPRTGPCCGPCGG
ncbi:hypothetical protein K1Y78_41650, partial [Streptomyces sp. tea 10]|nr:hypothetical protein [Streptomyces sp. tea 10]